MQWENTVEMNEKARILEAIGFNTEEKMKEYKVITAKTPKESEELMNKYAKNGWIVKTVTFCNTGLSVRIMITFEKDINAVDSFG